MDDTTYFTVQIKGEAYRFKPFPPEDLERVTMIMHLGVSGSKSIRALTRLLAASAGEEQWDKITDRYMNGEITDVQDITVSLFKRLLERQAKAQKSGQPKGLDVAATLRPADAE